MSAFRAQDGKHKRNTNKNTFLALGYRSMSFQNGRRKHNHTGAVRALHAPPVSFIFTSFSKIISRGPGPSGGFIFFLRFYAILECRRSFLLYQMLAERILAMEFIKMCRIQKTVPVLLLVLYTAVRGPLEEGSHGFARRRRDHPYHKLSYLS